MGVLFAPESVGSKYAVVGFHVPGSQYPLLLGQLHVITMFLCFPLSFTGMQEPGTS